MKVAYQGIEGAFSHITARRIFGPSVQFIGCFSFEQVVSSVDSGCADAGVLPIENTLAGTIEETVDLLNNSSLQIIGSAVTRIEHCLIGKKGEKTQKVFSHPKALAQCRKFFESHPEIELVPYYDTAGACRDLSGFGSAAIAHKEAASLYHLDVLRENIEDHFDNFTRFFIVSKRKMLGSNCFCCFPLEHSSAILAEYINLLKENDVNITFFSVRPIRGQPFTYRMFWDLENVSEAILDKIKSKVKNLKVLGSYERIQCFRDWDYKF